MKHLIRFSGALVLSLFINLIWSGSQGITASTGATPEIELLNSTVDEDVSVGGPSIPVFMHYYKQMRRR